MTDTANLRILVQSSGSREAERELRRLEEQAGRTGRSAGVMGSAVKKAGGAIAAYFTVQAAVGVIKMADSFNLLQKRVERLSDSSEDGTKKYKALTDIAVSTGADLQTTVKLWEQLDQTLSEFGKSDTEVLQLTEMLNKLGVIGASSADELKNSMRQFSQAMAGGVMRGEEFNSIIENTPEIARSMARGMDMSMGEMRQAMLEGELTADRVFSALMSQAEYVNDEFGKMPRTIDKASEALKTNFGNAVAELDSQIGVSTFLIAFMDGLGAVASTGAQQWADADLNELNRLEEGVYRFGKELEALEAKGPGFGFVKLFRDDKKAELKSLIAEMEETIIDLRAANATAIPAINPEWLNVKQLSLAEQYGETKVSTDQRNQAGKEEQLLLKEIELIKLKEQMQAKARAASLAKLKSQLDSEEQKILDSYNNRREAIENLSLTKEEITAAGFANEAAMMDEYNAANLAKLTEQNDAIIEKKREMVAREKEIEDEAKAAKAEADKSALQLWIDDAEKQKTTFDGMWGDAFTSFTRGFGDAVAESIMNGESLGDTMRGVANGLAKSMISALVEIAAQEMVLWGLKQMIGSAEGVSHATAVGAQATSQVFMTGLNALSSTAAIPIVGPAAAPAAAKLAISQASPMAAAAIAAAYGGIAGARAQGGQVMGGSAYKGAEFGMEMFQGQSGASYFIPPENGKVVPNHQMGQGGGNTTVNVINNSGQESQTSTSTDQNGNEVIDIIIGKISDQVESGNGFGRTMENAYGLVRQI